MKPPVFHSFDAHEDFVLGLAFTADSRTLVSAGMDGLIKVWSAEDWQHRATFAGHTARINCIALSPDNRVLASGSHDATVKLWSFPDGRLLRSFGHRRKFVTSVAFSADSRWIASACYGGRARVWTVAGKAVLKIVAGKQNLTSIALSPDGRTAVVSGEGGEISVWSLPDGQRLATLDSRSVWATSLRFIANGRVLMSLGFEKDLVIWNTTTWQRIWTYPMDHMDIYGVVVSPNETLVGVSQPGKVELRSTSDMELQSELFIDTPRVSALAFSPDGRWVALGAGDRKVRLWRLRNWTP